MGGEQGAERSGQRLPVARYVHLTLTRTCQPPHKSIDSASDSQPLQIEMA